MRICYFSVYDLTHTRNKVIMQGLEENNVDLIKCIADGKTPFKQIKALFKLFLVRNKFDVLYLGILNQAMMPFVKLITKKPVIFDPYLSIYDAIVFDKKTHSKDSLIAKVAFWIDNYATQKADKIAFATEENIRYFMELFNVKRDKFFRIEISAEDKLFYPRKIKKNKNKFIVEFHGRFIPLQGIQYIVKAAKLLEEYRDIEFRLIGDGQTYKENFELAKNLGLKNVKFLGYKQLQEIPDELAQSDISLGVFGDTPKTQLVTPNKVYEATAMRIAVLSADTPAMRDLVKHKESAYLCETANEKALADAILELKNNPELREKIANGGYKVFMDKCRPKSIGKIIVEEARELVR